MLKKYFLIICVLCSVILTSSLSIYANSVDDEKGSGQEITVGVYSYEPFMVVENNQVKGFFIDLLETVAEEEQWNVQYQIYSFSNGLKAVEHGDVDLMLGVAWSASRDELYDYNEESFFVNWGQIYNRKGLAIESMTDLEGKVIGVYRNDIHYIGDNGLKNTLDQFEINASYVEYEDYYDIMVAIESGFVDAGIVGRTAGSLYENELNVEKTAIQLNPVQFHVISPEGKNKSLLNVVDQYVSEWKEDSNSIYYHSLDKWFEDTIGNRMPRKFWMVLWSGLGVVIFLTCVVIVAQKIIRQQTKELRHLNNHLEQKVEERTLELNGVNERLKESMLSLEDKQANLEEMNAILEEQLAILEKTQGQLVESEKMASLGRMVSSLAHEMNTPLGICVTLTSNLKSETRSQLVSLNDNKVTRKALNEYLEDVNHTSKMFENNLHSLVELVKRFKMLSSDKSQLSEHRINLHEYLHMQLNALSPELKYSGHSYEIHCPEDLEAVVDPFAITQLIRNLTMNSLIHGFEETSRGKIQIDVNRKDNRIVMAYSDNGKGIDKNIREQVFEPFYTTRRKEGDTGLGLSIAHSAVKQSLDGDIWIDPNYETGVKFMIEWPYSNNE